MPQGLVEPPGADPSVQDFLLARGWRSLCEAQHFCPECRLTSRDVNQEVLVAAAARQSL